MTQMRAKMKVAEVISYENSEVLKMTAVCGAFDGQGNSEDNTYALFTPAGTIQLTINNPNLIEKIKPGQKFYVDFTLAEK